MGQEQGQGGMDTDKSEKLGTGLSKQWKERDSCSHTSWRVTHLTSRWVLFQKPGSSAPQNFHVSLPSRIPLSKHNLTQSSEAELNLTANSQIQYESLWPQVRVSQAQHPKPGDCVSFKHQSINRAKSQENT